MNAFDIKDSILKSLCDYPRGRFILVKPPFWTAEIYGFGRELRRYGFYPGFLPLCIFTDHGPGYHDYIQKCERDSGAPIQLFHSPKSLSLWKNFIKKEAYCFYSPFIFYRKRNSIFVEDGATGTVAFPAHSTPSIHDENGYDKYIKDLMDLPQVYHPITVCMHMHDIIKNLHLGFLRKGFTVVTAGNVLDQRFIPRFYDIITKNRFATSSIPGSYAYYCAEAGIPFFVYGEKPSWNNEADTNIPLGSYDPWSSGYGKAITEIFTATDLATNIPVVTVAQAEFVSEHLGLYDGISRARLCSVLYRALFLFIFTPSGLKYIINNNIIAIIIKKILNYKNKTN